MNTPKKSRIAQNAIYVTPGDPASGLLAITDLGSATQFRDRFRSGTYAVPSTSDQISDLKEYVGVTVNEDGSITRPEVFPAQSNGYDSYANGIGGFMRREQAYSLTPQALGKISLIALDALHEKALSEDETESTDARVVLSVLRSFDGVAEQQTAERIAGRKREVAINAMVAAGVTRERAEAIIAEPTAAPVPVSTVEAPPKNKGNKKREHSEATA